MKGVQHLWKHMRTHRKPQWLHKNTSALWEGKVTRLNCQKLFDMLSKSWDKVSGWGVSSSPSLLLLIFFNRQRVFCLAQSWVWCNILCNWESFTKRQNCSFRRRACSSSAWRIFDFSLSWTQFSDSHITLTHEWSWWVHSAHLECDFIITQRIEWLKQ